MTTDEIILKSIEKCLEQASDPKQKRLFHWMKAAIQYPSIEAFFNEVQAAGQGCGIVTSSALDKAFPWIQMRSTKEGRIGYFEKIIQVLNDVE